MNDVIETSGIPEKQKTVEATARLEVCDECEGERNNLSAEIGGQTLASENPTDRLLFLEAHLAKLDISEAKTSVSFLLSYELERQTTDPKFDLTTFPKSKVERLLERNNTTLDAERTTTEAERLSTDMVNKEKNYNRSIARLKSEGKSTVEIINALIDDENVPESERAKLRSFQAIMGIAQAVPEDAQIIGIRLNNMDFSAGIPDPNSFATWAIFDSPELQTGISQSTQDAIAAKLGIMRHKHTVETGTDVYEVFKKGQGTQTYLDKNGEVQTRTVPLSPGKDVEIRENQFLSVDNAGNKYLKISSKVGNYTVSLPDNSTAEDMTQIVSSTQMIAILHDLNLAEIMYGRPMTDRGGGEIKLRLPADTNRTKQLEQIFFGATAGYDGEILTQSDIDKIPYLMQFRSSEGDAMRGDIAPDMMRADLEKQGVIKNRSIDWVRFEEMVMANRTNMYITKGKFDT